MRRNTAFTTLALIGAMVFSIDATAQQQQPQPPRVQLVLYGTTAETVLRAPALSGSPEFTNNGSYWGVVGELATGKLSIYAAYQGGKAKVIPGGTMMPPAPTFQPLTGERSDVIDVVVGYTVLDSATIGKVDLFGGYYRLWAEPMISPANWYEGPEVGVKGRREWTNGMAVEWKVGYVPTYTVNGYVHKSLAQDDIWLLRAAGEIPVYRKIFVTGGYQHMRLEAAATADNSVAVVTFGGFFLGGGYRF